MATAEVFQYRHKKFDQRKRCREEDAIVTPLNDELSLESTKWNTVPNLLTPKQRKTTEAALTPKKNSKAKNTIDTELRQKMELIDLNEQTMATLDDTTVAINPPKRRQLLNPIQIKMEVFDSTETLSKLTTSKRRRTQSRPIKKEQPQQQVQSYNKLPIEIKEELIELNGNVPVIPRDAYEEICKFRGNMVRKFPKKERSPKEQERRDKNTFACRRSRRVKKIEQVAVDEEYKGYKDTHIRMAEYTIRAAAYFKELMNLTETAISDVIVID